VRNWFNRFVDEAKGSDLMSAARAYGVEGQVRELMRLSQELKDSELEVSECVAGSRTVKTLRSLEVDESRFQEFVHSVYTEVVAQSLSPGEFVNTCSRLRSLRRQSGKGYLEITEEFQGYLESNKRLGEESARLEDERREQQKLLLQEVREKDTTLATLVWFDETRSILKEQGVEVEELDRLGTLMKNFVENGFDAEEIVEFYASSDQLGRQKEALEKEVASLTDEHSGLKDRNSALTETVKENQGLVASINELQAMGLSHERTGVLLEKVIEISSKHDMERSEALEKFISELSLQYEPKLGYENQLSRLEARLTKLRDDIQEKETSLERLNRVYEAKAKTVESLNILNENGVGNDDLILWMEILQETETDLITLRKEMAQLGGLRQYFEEQRKEVASLETNIVQLKNVISELGIEKEGLEAALSTLTFGTLADVKKELQRLPGIIDELRKDLLDPETGLKAESLEMIDETHKAIGDLLKGKETHWSQLLQEGEDKIKKMDDGLEELLKATYAAGQMVGEYKALEPVHRLQTGEDPGYNQGLLAILTMAVHFRTWFEKNGLTKGQVAAHNMIDSIEEELRDPGRIRYRSVPK
jgi:hypothetical protein